MRILMLGNSFTTANHMPDMLAELTGAEIVQHTRGGERLADQLNPKTKMGKRTQEALQNEKWDFVILQEMEKRSWKLLEWIMMRCIRNCMKLITWQQIETIL